MSAYEKSRQSSRDANKRYYSKNKESIAAKTKAYTQANRERKYLRDKLWRQANADRVRALHKAAYYANPAKARAKSANYRAMKMRATPAWLTAEHRAQISACYARAAETTKVTGIAHEVDHIVPLAGKNVCGLHVPWNLQAIPLSENRRKKNRLLEDNESYQHR